MTTPNPITPPPDLVFEWENKYHGNTFEWVLRHVATEAAQWGADQELEACCEWFASDVVSEVIDVVSDLRAARRPSPPSLKEQALEQLREVNAMLQFQTTGGETSAIRRALEALPDDTPQQS